MMRTTVLPVLLLASLAVQAQAHHSLTEYDGSRTTTLDRKSTRLNSSH